MRRNAIREAVLNQLGCGRDMITACLWQSTSNLGEEESEDKCHASAVDHCERAGLYVCVDSEVTGLKPDEGPQGMYTPLIYA